MTYFEHVARCTAAKATPLPYVAFLRTRDQSEGAAK